MTDMTRLKSQRYSTSNSIIPPSHEKRIQFPNRASVLIHYLDDLSKSEMHKNWANKWSQLWESLCVETLYFLTSPFQIA